MTTRLVQGLCAALTLAVTACAGPAGPHRHLLIVVDGLRPDYVTPEVMPNLVALGKRGVVFTRHHAVYPTVTRVNAASISTGAYPETHGLMGNTVFFPRVSAATFLDTADRRSLETIAATEGRLLTAPTLAEALQAAGRRLLVASSGSAGSALLANHTIAGGAILHYQFALPERWAEDLKAIGSAPGDDAPAGERDRYAVTAFLDVGLRRVDPSVTVLWLSDLDDTAHATGIGSSETIAILRSVDGEIARIEAGLRVAGLADDYNIWVTSDHGFSTYTGAVDLAALLKPFMGTLPDGSPRIVSGGGAIYVRDGDDEAVSAIVRALQRTPGVGAIFTQAPAPGDLTGHVPGTLSFDAARGSHDRAAQILFSPDWTDTPNAHGFAGTSASNGAAGHGSSSPWDVHNTLIAAGPDLKSGVTIDTPSANVDFGPTFLHLFGIRAPTSFQGRVLEEALIGSPLPDASAVRTADHVSSAPGYSLALTVSTVLAAGREYRYFDRTRVTRSEVADGSGAAPPRQRLR
jgi:arylsulfatase A-like enzyme